MPSSDDGLLDSHVDEDAPLVRVPYRRWVHHADDGCRLTFVRWPHARRYLTVRSDVRGSGVAGWERALLLPFAHRLAAAILKAGDGSP